MSQEMETENELVKMSEGSRRTRPSPITNRLRATGATLIQFAHERVAKNRRHAHRAREHRLRRFARDYVTKHGNESRRAGRDDGWRTRCQSTWSWRCRWRRRWWRRHFGRRHISTARIWSGTLRRFRNRIDGRRCHRRPGVCSGLFST